jgi:hypothetical protein
VTSETPALSDEEFLARFGDAIDDRVAEILDELLDERNLVRRHQLLGMIRLVLAALAACVAAAWIIQTVG